MTHINGNTKTVKGKHLSRDERIIIQTLINEGYSNRQIAGKLGRAPQTINNEIKRGMYTQKSQQLQNNKIYTYYKCVYSPDLAQDRYFENRIKSGRRPIPITGNPFVEWADHLMIHQEMSPASVIMLAKKAKLFPERFIPCIKTLYNWIDRKLIKTRNINLLMKLKLKNKKPTGFTRINKKVLGQSIELRPHAVDTRTTFGHWEIDTVVGQKSGEDQVLLTMVERKSRYELILKIDGKQSCHVVNALRRLIKETGDAFPKIFKSITADNGPEFSDLSECLKGLSEVYFTHPYASWERGTKENQHRFIRRHIHKGIPISTVTASTVHKIQEWMNRYPRKILNGQSAMEVFLKELIKENILSESLGFYMN